MTGTYNIKRQNFEAAAMGSPCVEKRYAHCTCILCIEKAPIILTLP